MEAKEERLSLMRKNMNRSFDVGYRYSNMIEVSSKKQRIAPPKEEPQRQRKPPTLTPPLSADKVMGRYSPISPPVKRWEDPENGKHQVLHRPIPKPMMPFEAIQLPQKRISPQKMSSNPQQCSSPRQKCISPQLEFDPRDPRQKYLSRPQRQYISHRSMLNDPQHSSFKEREPRQLRHLLTSSELSVRNNPWVEWSLYPYSMLPHQDLRMARLPLREEEGEASRPVINEYLRRHKKFDKRTVARVMCSEQCKTERSPLLSYRRPHERNFECQQEHCPTETSTRVVSDPHLARLAWSTSKEVFPVLADPFQAPLNLVKKLGDSQSSVFQPSINTLHYVRSAMDTAHPLQESGNESQEADDECEIIDVVSLSPRGAGESAEEMFEPNLSVDQGCVRRRSIDEEYERRQRIEQEYVTNEECVRKRRTGLQYLSYSTYSNPNNRIDGKKLAASSLLSPPLTPELTEECSSSRQLPGQKALGQGYDWNPTPRRLVKTFLSGDTLFTVTAQPMNQPQMFQSCQKEENIRQIREHNKEETSAQTFQKTQDIVINVLGKPCEEQTTAASEVAVDSELERSSSSRCSSDGGST